MNYSLTRPTHESAEDAMRQSVVLTTIQDMLAWGRKNSIWPFNFGLSCCYKDHPARATEMGPFELSDEKERKEQAALKFRPEDWGLKRVAENSDFMFLNLGPQHPGTHGLIRFVLQLDGEEIADSVLDIGYHHRGAEKMAARQAFTLRQCGPRRARHPAHLAWGVSGADDRHGKEGHAV
jgi:hypothetical protein